MPKPSYLKKQEYHEGVSELRQKLSTVAWIQCDDLSCLKWRKVHLEVAQQVAEDTPWTCDMNKDENYNRCSIPEEDTTGYEKLAKRIKMDFIINSRLQPGTLVWAKVQGYCRWPALITPDPLNGEYTDDDDCQAVQYHVEFLGDKRSHGWVKTKFIEMFGPGNIDSVTDKTLVDGHSQQGQANQFQNQVSVVKHKDGNPKVQKAIKEALQLLPLQLGARLDTCQFVTLSDVYKRTRGKTIKLPKVTHVYDLRNSVPTHNNCICLASNHSNNTALKHSCRKLCCQQGIQKVKKSNRDILKENRKNVGRKSKHGVVVKRQLQVVSDNQEAHLLLGNVGMEMRKPEFLLFAASSLVNSSTQECFLKDVQIYQQHEHTFEQELAKFNMAATCGAVGGTHSESLMWQNVPVGKFTLFLAVLERGGFLHVCNQHLWSSVYAEVTHHYWRQGAALCKQYYHRHLYPFEVYSCGMNNIQLVLQHPIRTAGKQASDFHGEVQDLGSLFDDCDGFDSPDIVRHLDELEEVLKSLEQKEGKSNQAYEPVPPTCLPVQVCKSNSNDALSSHCSSDIQVLHEMQALQYDLNCLQDEIDVL